MSFTAFGPIYKAAAALMPAKLDTPEARAMLFAIAMQESRLDARRQLGGPARSFWQFEFGGIKAVLNHPASKPLIFSVLDRLDYEHTPDVSYVAIEHNDVLAFAYARCLFWTLPSPLPTRAESEEGWTQYTEAWRPGKPHPASWEANFKQAWDFTDKGA